MTGVANGTDRPLVTWLAVATSVVALYVLIDAPLSLALRGVDPAVIAPFQAVTWTGDSSYTLVPLGLATVIATAAWAALRDRPGRAAAATVAGGFGFVFAAIAVSGIVVNVLKVLIGRSRPKLLDEAGFYGFEPFRLDYAFQSFPSGHANTLFAAAMAIGLLVPAARWPLLCLAALLASSRFMINAHFLGDVVGGAAVAVLTTLALRAALAERGWLFERRPARGIGLGPTARALGQDVRGLIAGR